MNPILPLDEYELADYQTAVNTLNILCEGENGVQQIVTNKLLECYLMTTIGTLDYFTSPLPVDVMFKRIKDLNLFNDNVLWVYNFVKPFVSGWDSVAIENNIGELNRFRTSLDNLFTDAGTILQKFTTHRIFFQRLLGQPLPFLNDQDCGNHAREFIGYLKDCYIDVMTVRLDQLRIHFRNFYSNPNPDTYALVYTALNDIRASLISQVTLRDYDTFVFQALFNVPPNQAHLTPRNKPIPILKDLQVIIDKITVGIPNIDESVKLVNKFQNYINETYHGELVE